MIMRTFSLFVVALFLFVTQADAQQLTIEMTGQSGPSNILSAELNWQKPQATTGQSRRRGRVQVEDLVVTRKPGRDTPGALQNLTSGSVIQEIVIRSMNGNDATFTMTLSNAMISAHSLSMDTKRSMETFSITFEKISFEHASGSKHEYSVVSGR